jgi:hypothetical protein
LGDVVVLMPPLAMGLDDLGRIVDALATEISRLGHDERMSPNRALQP